MEQLSSIYYDESMSPLTYDSHPSVSSSSSGGSYSLLSPYSNRSVPSSGSSYASDGCRGNEHAVADLPRSFAQHQSHRLWTDVYQSEREVDSYAHWHVSSPRNLHSTPKMSRHRISSASRSPSPSYSPPLPHLPIGPVPTGQRHLPSSVRIPSPEYPLNCSPSSTGRKLSPANYDRGFDGNYQESAAFRSEAASKSPRLDLDTVPLLLRDASLTCVVCGDKGARESFGVTACDSCRGFFKRSVKNDRKYSCLLSRSCVLTKRKRNHCKACRLAKCFSVGMKANAAQNEADRDKAEKLRQKQSRLASLRTAVERQAAEPETVDIALLLSAEDFVDPNIDKFANVSIDPIRHLCLAADKQLASLAEWAKRLPHFRQLPVMNQVRLLEWNWTDLLVGGFCYRSTAVKDGILLSTGLHLSKDNLIKAGVAAIVNKLFVEVINKMQKLQIDLSEWACLRAIMLFAPDSKGLENATEVDKIRTIYMATLQKHCTETYPSQPHRIGSLLLRLPPLKAIALQILEHLFFFRLIGDVPIDTFLLEMLDSDEH